MESNDKLQARTPEQITEILTREIPKDALKKRTGGGGKQLVYAPGDVIIRRLINATNNQFSVSILDITEKIISGQTMLTARVCLTIPGLGSREHLGVQLVSERGGEDLVKGCITDAIKKCATLFGVALELYGADYEDYSDAREPEASGLAKARAAAAVPPSRPALVINPTNQAMPAPNNAMPALAPTTDWEKVRAKFIQDAKRVYGYKIANYDEALALLCRLSDREDAGWPLTVEACRAVYGDAYNAMDVELEEKSGVTIAKPRDASKAGVQENASF